MRHLLPLNKRRSLVWEFELIQNARWPYSAAGHFFVVQTTRRFVVLYQDSPSRFYSIYLGKSAQAPVVNDDLCFIPFMR